MNAQPAPESGPDDTRQRIMEAAFSLFAEAGYRGTTTRAIAAAAGVNEVTLFRHFGSKKGLFMACMEAFNAEGFTGTFRDHLTGDYRADLLTLARLQEQDMAEGFEIMRMLLCDSAEVPEIREVALAGGRSNQALLAGYFREQIERGVVRADLSPDALAHAFDSLFSTAVFYRMVFQDDFAPDLSGEALRQQLVDVFARGTMAQNKE